jgi:hypothetical protein
MTARAKKPFGILGIGAAACVACCAGPFVGFIAATGVLTATTVALFGTIGFLIAIPALVLIARRRARPLTCTPPNESTSVALPSRRA